MRLLRLAGLVVLTAMAGAGIFVWAAAARTEADIAAFEARVAELGAAAPAPGWDGAADLSHLPDPVRRYFGFVFRGEVPPHGVVRIAAEGDFRRPLTEEFAPTRAAQVIAIGTPALMFSATTPVGPGLWARAYDVFAGGRMEMKAKVLSALTVMDEGGTEALNRLSLRRWLLESALYPQALLPGGPVRWEAMDDARARAVVESRGLSAAMVAHFDAEGRMTHMSAEEDGDLTTPYHGSGEHVIRADYRRVGDQMIPMGFTISRAAGGEILPFWEGRVTAIEFR